MSRPRATGECEVCGDPNLYAKGLCRPDYLRRRRGFPDLDEETRVARNYQRWAREVERERIAQLLLVTYRG